MLLDDHVGLWDAFSHTAMHHVLAQMNMQFRLRYFFGNFSTEAKERWSNLCQVSDVENQAHVMHAVFLLQAYWPCIRTCLMTMALARH